MCRCLAVQSSGYYAWQKSPLSQRAREDARQTALIRRAWNDSGKVYGYRKLHDDLLDHGETCCPNRVARLTRLAGIKAQIGYKRGPGSYGGKPSLAVDNTLDRQFDVAAPDRAWVTDITYIRTLEGFAYLAVVIDLYSRRVVGWSMQSRLTTDVVLQALHMAVWRRKPRHRVLIHSDQGSQFTTMDWAAFIRAHNLARQPFVPLDHGPQVKICFPSCSYRMLLLTVWSLRKTRDASHLFRRKQGTGKVAYGSVRWKRPS